MSIKERTSVEKAAIEVAQLILDMSSLLIELKKPDCTKGKAYDLLWKHRRTLRRKMGKIIASLEYTTLERHAEYIDREKYV